MVVMKLSVTKILLSWGMSAGRYASLGGFFLSSWTAKLILPVAMMEKDGRGMSANKGFKLQDNRWHHRDGYYMDN